MQKLQAHFTFKHKQHFGKMIYSRLYNKCIYDLKFGFCENHSTNHALVSLTECIRQALIDLQKAFDTVDHNILLKKLYHYVSWSPSNRINESARSDSKLHLLHHFRTSAIAARRRLLWEKISFLQDQALHLHKGK